MNCTFKTLVELYLAFLKIGSFTFGGGYAMLPMMQDELINSRHWITDDELLDYYAVGQSTPGIIAVNVATFVGFKQGGIPGGIVATLGIITPSIVIITLLATLINSVDKYPLVQKALKGINVSVAALVTDANFNFVKKTCRGLASVMIMALSFLLIYFFNVPSYFIILETAVLALTVYFWRK